MRVESILIVSFSHIGDAVLSTAVIPPIKRHFPDANISILVGPNASDILWGDVRLNKIIIYDNKGQHKDYKGLNELVNELINLKFDLVINLRDSLWARFVGKKSWNMPLLRRFLPKYKELHAVDRYLDILQSHGVDVSGAVPKIILLDFEKQQSAEFLYQNNVKPDELLIGIHPGGSWKYKLWSVKKFSALGDFLVREFNAKVLVFAGSDEAILQNQMAEMMRYKPIVIQNIGLRQLASLIQRCNLYIGNDTGPMHIASAVGTRVVSLFGSTSANRSGPYGNNHVVISAKLDCSPCHPGKHPGGCNLGTCLAMDSISYEQVANVVGRIIHEQRSWHLTC